MKAKILILLFCLCNLFDGYAQNKEENIETIAILSINDFHGGFVRDNRTKKEIPGAGNLLAVIDSLKMVYPYHIVVAAGDNFGGNYFSRITNGSLIPEFFNRSGIKISALGNHEFDNGQVFLADKWKDSSPEGWDLTYVCANVKDAKTYKTPTWAVPMKKDTLMVQESPVIVNFVGLIAESAPKQTAKENVKGLFFNGHYNNVLDSLSYSGFASESISNSNINILLTHIGTEMSSDSTITWTDGEQDPKQQIQKNPLYHGILSAHSHKIVCGKKTKCR